MIVKKLVSLSSVFVLSLSSFMALHTVSATSLFRVSIVSDGDDPFVIEEEASSLPDLLEDVFDADNTFEELEDVAWSGVLTYLGTPEAFEITSDANGENIQLRSELTGLVVEFEGGTRDETSEEIEDWFLEEGIEEVANIEKVVVTRSAAAFTDGNPNATTAKLAKGSYRAFGLFSPSSFDSLVGEADSFGNVIELGFEYSDFNVTTPSGEIEGERFQAILPFRFRFPFGIDVVGTGNFEYMDLADSEIYGGGLILGVPIGLLKSDEDQKFAWMLTPNLGLEGRGSYDAAIGGLLMQYGITSKLDYVLNRGASISLINQVSSFETMAVTINDTRFDPDVDQWILKNGLALNVRVTDKLESRMYATNTACMNDAAVDNYNTVGLSARYWLLKQFSIRAYLEHTFADDFEGSQFGASSSFRF